MNRSKIILAAALACALAACAAMFAGCAEQNGQDQPQYADEAFMQSLAKGYEARDALVESPPRLTSLPSIMRSWSTPS